MKSEKKVLDLDELEAVAGGCNCAGNSQGGGQSGTNVKQMLLSQVMSGLFKNDNTRR